MASNKDNGYYKALIIAIALHVGLLVLFIIHFKFDVTKVDLNVASQQKIIKAHTVIATKKIEQAKKPVKPAKPKVQPKPKPVVKKQVAFKSKIKPKPKPKPKPKKQVQAKPKPKLTQAQRMAALAKKLQAQTRENMQKQLQADQKQLDQQLTQAKRTQRIVDKYKAMILQQVGQKWIVPEINKEISCRLLITLAPGGTVLKVKLVKSSGNAALDRSAIQAVYKASPLPVPKDENAFNAMRELDMTVRPESAVSKVVNTGGDQ